MQMNKQLGQARYADDLVNVPQGMGMTRNNLQRLLRSLDFVGWSKSEESGRLDRRALTKFAIGSANVFSRRQYVEAETSAVSVLIDCSGSMNDGTPGSNISKITVAQTITVHLSNLLHKARVPFTVTGFRSGKNEYLNEYPEGGGRVESPQFIPFKPWRQSLLRSIPALGNIKQCAYSGTPDYSAIANAIDDLAQRPEHRRILFILTDANGYMRSHMQHLQTLADKVGVTIVAIGIKSPDVLDCFVDAVNVDKIEDLGATAFNQLLKTVRRKVA